eukprot:PhM_4_TR4089/c1_g1_i1/m.35181/K20222/IPO5, KPNB3, RANBP5; importin-5
MTDLPTQDVFEKLVGTLYSHDNVQRKEAEAYYNSLREGNPTWICRAHLAVMKAAQMPDTRYMCGILLRRILAPEAEVYTKLAPEDRNAIKSDLVELFRLSDLPPNVRRGVTFCVSAVILNVRDSDEWMDIVPFLLQSVANGDSQLRLACALVFKQVATSLVDKFMASRFVGALCDAMATCLRDIPKVRVAAVEAIGQFVGVMEETDFDKLRSLVPVILQSLQQTLNENDQGAAGEMLDPLVYICDNNAEFYGPHMANMVRAMLDIANTPNVNTTLLTYCVEFLLSFCEGTPKVARKVPGFAKEFFELCLKLATYPPEQHDWETTYEEDENADDINAYDVGLEGLDRLAAALKGKTMEPIASEYIVRFSQNDDWHYRQAATVCIGQIAEGCHDALFKNLNNIIPLLINKCSDAHPRVRYSSMASLAQMFTDFEGELSAFHEDVVPVIIRLIEDPIPRIQAIAAATVCNFTSSAHDIEKYAGPLLRATYELLHKTQYIFVKEQCLAAISSVAENSGEFFGEFYDTLTPVLRSVLDLPDREENRTMKYRALEAITLMAVAVGRHRFEKDAAGVCSYLAHQQSVSTDDQFMRYIVRGWASMARCLREGFAPYLDSALRPVLHILAQEVSIDLVDDDVTQDDCEEGVQLISLCIKGVGDKRVKIHTSLIEDKTLAMSMLLAFLEATGNHILPHLDNIIATITPLLTFTYVEDVRISAAQASSLCIASAARASEANGGNYRDKVRDMSTHFMQKLLAAVQKEQDVTTLSEMLTAMHTILNLVPGGNLIPDAPMEGMANVMKQVFDESISRRQELFKEMADLDEEDVDGVMEEHEDEERLLIEAVDVIGALLKTHDNFFDIFINRFLPQFAQLLDEKAGNTEHKIAICVLDDFMDHKPEAALNYFDKILAALLKYVNADNFEVMQASSYGIGVAVGIMSRFNQVRDAQFGVAAAQALYKNLNHPGEQSEEYLHALANVAAATIRVMRAFPSELAAQEETLLRAIIAKLPMRMDTTEAQFVHGALVQMQRAGHPVVCAEQKNIFEALKKVAQSDLVDDETRAALQ